MAENDLRHYQLGKIFGGVPSKSAFSDQPAWLTT